MDNQICACHKLKEIRGYGVEQWFVFEKLIGDAMHFHGSFVHFALGVNILVIMSACEFAIDHFYTANFNNPVVLGSFQSSGFCI